jgi:hypothetical protein
MPEEKTDKVIDKKNVTGDRKIPATAILRSKIRDLIKSNSFTSQTKKGK